MLDPALVPTPLRGRPVRPVSVREPQPPGHFRSLLILRHGASFLTWIVRRRLQGGPTAAETGRQLRAVFESLGGLWIKLGQLVAMRRDLLPADFCAEIGRLQDRATGFPGRIARQTIEEDLGRPIEELFDAFEDHPFAAASIGQLHRARVRGTGRVLAIKVRRPYVQAIVEADLAFLRRVFLSLHRLGIRRNFHWHDLVRELTRAMQEELDYRLEAASIRRMRRNLRAHRVYVPRVFRRLSSRHVLAMEFVSGALMSDFIAARDADPEAAERWLSENRIDPGRVGRTLYLSLIRQILEDNLFHGDLHPGNIILLRRSRIALIDFGSVGSLESRFRKLYVLLNSALAESDYEKAADVLSLVAPRAETEVDWDRMRRIVSGALRRAEMRAWAPNLTYHERSMNAAMADVARSLSGSRIPVGWAFMRVDRAHVTLDASLMYLVPDVNYVTLGRRYFREARRRATGPGVWRILADRARRLRVGTAASGTLSERLALQRDVLRAGGAVFQSTTRHLGVLIEEASGLAGRALLALALVTAVVVGARSLSGPVAAAVRGALPLLAAAAPRLGAIAWILLLTGLTAAAAQLLALERRLERLRTGDGAEPGTEMD